MPSTRRQFIQASTAAGAGIIAAQLPDAATLPFSDDALEPVIDAKTVELHYNSHHKPAAAAANKAAARLRGL